VTLTFKRLRIRQVLGGAPENLRYVAVDFQKEDLREVLLANEYDPALRTFVIMEGVTMYLKEEALRATLGFIGSHRAGSSVVFDFVTSAMVAGLRRVNPNDVPEAGRIYMQRFLNLIRDEPWEYGFPLNAERETIESFGFDVRDLIMLDGEEAARRYLTRSDGTEVGAATMAQRAKVPARMARAQREAMAYRICEAVVAQRH
jgi:methyltransferase (TIGR00027 family)